MKPDWKDAPEWANWLGMDYDGVWAWHHDKPELKFARDDEEKEFGYWMSSREGGDGFYLQVLHSPVLEAKP